MPSSLAFASSNVTRRFRALALAVSPRDRLEFLPGAMLEEVGALGDSFSQFDPSGKTEDGAWASFLQDQNPEVLITGWRTPALPECLPPSLRYVCNLTGTVRELLTRRHLEDGLIVTNWGGSIARVVAEGAFYHVLACLRRGTHWTLAMHRDGGWKTRESESASLFGRRVGIHGFGRIARELLALLAPFSPVVSVFAPDVGADEERIHGIRRAASLEALFEQNDIVIELAPLNAETAGIITERHLRLLHPGSVFVNTGRGKVVDEAGLVRVAREGEVLFGLDVFAAEPLVADHPLRGLANVSLTPHMSGPTTERRCDAGAHALKNLRAYFAGQPLESVITPEYYDICS